MTELSNNPFTQLNLKEHTLYKVKVKISKDNVEHESFLFTGFKTGSYCMVYNNNYEYPVKLQDVHSMEILKELSTNNG